MDVSYRATEHKTPTESLRVERHSATMCLC